MRAGTGAGAGTGTGTGYVGGLACGLQVLHVLRPGVAFGNAVETLGFDWPRCADSDEHSPFTTHSPHSSGGRTEQQPCWSRMPVALAFGCFGRGDRKTESEVDAPATATATVSARWGGDGCQSLGVQASLAASQTLDRCAGMVEGRMRV